MTVNLDNKCWSNKVATPTAPVIATGLPRRYKIFPGPFPLSTKAGAFIKSTLEPTLAPFLNPIFTADSNQRLVRESPNHLISSSLGFIALK